jgi:hypothetical protein
MTCQGDYKLGGAGHVARIAEGRTAIKILTGKPTRRLRRR